MAKHPSLPAGVDRPTASFGVVGTRDRTAGLQRLLREADRALYDAKAEGRNRAVVGFSGAGAPAR